MIKLKSLIDEGEFGTRTALEVETENFRQSLIHQYPQIEDLDFHLKYGQDVLHLSSIKIKKEFRNRGIGKKIILALKLFKMNTN